MHHPRSRIFLCLLLALCPVTRVGAQSTDKPTVDQLAHDGYWLPDQKSAFDTAMGMLNKRAPALHLSNWHGVAPTGDVLKDKIVLIDFWATWCGPCIAQIPHANAIAAKYADKGVVVFGACCPKGAEIMAQTAVEKSMSYPTGQLGPDDTKAWNITFWPTYAIIDRQRKLRAIGLRPDYVEQVLDALLVEQPPASATAP